MAKLSLLFTQFILAGYPAHKSDANRKLYYTLLIRNSINIIGNVIYWAQRTAKKLTEKIVDNFLVIIQAFGNELFSDTIRDLIKQSVNVDCYEGIAKLLYAIPKIHIKYYRKKPESILQVAYSLITNISSELVEKTQFLKLKVEKQVSAKQVPNQGQKEENKALPQDDLDKAQS